MSDEPQSASLSPQAAISHSQRAWFEQWAFYLFIVVIAALVFFAIAGMVWPPAVPPARDWGQSIIQRFGQVYGPIIALLGTLMAPLGVSLTRGHMDEKLIQQ
jgi:phosphotransferase system  glucose/maltose/N-acetylglucosamine-specific IIC component